MSTRRFSAHAASSWPMFFGFSLPKLTVSTIVSCTPSSVHHPLDRVGALLAERDVVLARAALVGVALQRDARVAVGREVLRMRLDDRLVLVGDREAVELEVDAALATGCCWDPAAD